ncbi:hypothetical protein PGT21_033803 [Puccinia graminis f. sp. tritici]|uniref:Uncharacterized protein n=1 Tax=Puccinia graminis f. sp. tritici TaxID=56615 RepID=A0A5B0MR50_PUCGR|nr:hypothetical protein PGT21_033803 [Puccinia graminis f. sp. tritici]
MNHTDNSELAIGIENGSDIFEDDNHASELFDNSEESDGEGEDSQLDPQFLAQRKITKQRDTQKQKEAGKHKKRVHDVATTVDLPHSSSAISRSITDFTKFMMGCSSRNFQLPSPPAENEVQIWQDWIVERKDVIQKHLDAYIERKQPQTKAEKNFLVNQELTRIKRAILTTVYHPAATVKNSSFSLAIKIACDEEFKTSGFSRITFDWDKPNLDNSKWNGATATILASHWMKWRATSRSLLDDSPVNPVKIIERWLSTARKEIKRKETKKKGNKTPGDPSSLSAIKAKHKSHRKKVSEYRFKTALAVFPDNPEVSALFQNLDTVSDYEDNKDFRLPPVRINPTWRSTVFANLAHELDRATIQLAPQKSKSAISGHLARDQSRNATEDEAELEKVPPKMPIDAYSGDYLGQLSVLERDQMGIKDDISQYSLTSALADISKKTKPVNSMVE